MQITIDTLSVNVKNFITRYLAWHSSKLFVEHNRTSVIDLTGKGYRIPCFSDRDIKQINACPSPIVMIDSLNEGIRFQEHYNEYDKNKHYLLFVPWFNQSKIKLPINYTPIWYSHLLFDLVEDYVDPKSWYYYINRTYTFDYPKPCLSTTIAGQRDEREIIKHALVNSLEKNSFIFRYAGQDLGRSIDTTDVIDTSDIDFSFDNISQIFESKFAHIRKEPGFVIWKLVSMAAHNMSYFNLVLESDVTRDIFFMTEKTIKPLLIGQPFVMYGSCGFLQHLKNLGFSTFGDLWDESYDGEPSWKKRSEMVARLCIRLKDFDWDRNREQLQEICMKNQMHIHNLSAVAQQEFTEFESVIQNLSLETWRTTLPPQPGRRLSLR